MYTGGVFDSTESPDLGCYEDLEDSESESPQPTPPSPKRKRRQPKENASQREDPQEGCSQASSASFDSTPRKQKETPPDFPGDLYKCLSHAVLTNKTFNCFVLMSTLEKCNSLYDLFMEKYSPVYLSQHSGKVEEKEVGFMILMTPGKHRTSAVYRFGQSQCSLSFFRCKACISPPTAYEVLTQSPYTLIRENVPGMFMESEGERKEVDWLLLLEYAKEIRNIEPYLLLGAYLEFKASPQGCKKCVPKYPEHYPFHEKHHANAELLYFCRQQKLICTQATDHVIALQRVKMKDLSRKDVLADLFQKHVDDLVKYMDCKKRTLFILGAVAWWLQARTGGAKEAREILLCLTKNVPKRRNVIFRGGLDTGKTCYATLFLNFLEGVSLNVNCPFDKLNFELGCAMDKFMCVLEDVKGKARDGLPGGHGVDNLDSLRDYLDGQCPVNLERKHCNKVSQIFPPCIMTMNYYSLPESLRNRFCKVYPFPKRENIGRALDGSVMQEKRLHTSALTLMALLIRELPLEEFREEIRDKVQTAKLCFEEFCTGDEWATMTDNIQNGRDPLTKILYEPTEDMDTEMNDSGIFMVYF